MGQFDSLICSLLRSSNAPWVEDNTAKFESLIERAAHHGVLSILHYLLSNESTWTDHTEYLQESLSDARKNAVAISLARERAVASLLAVLANAEVTPLLIKGEALAHTHYPSPELRVRSDTDIFIAIPAISRTIQALESDGFSVTHPRYKSHQFTAIKTLPGGVLFRVDVHWRISNEPAFARLFSYEASFDRAVTANVAGRLCLVLHPVHALILACMHLSVQPEERSDRLIWIYDIHLLVSRMSEDELLEMGEVASKKGVGGICLQAIQKSEVCIGTSIPKVVTEALQSTCGAGVYESGYGQSYLALILADLRELPGLSQKWSLISELLFPGSEWLLNKYAKTHHTWVPILYLRYLASGFFNRLLLR